MKELKPCPFCGGEAIERDHAIHEGGDCCLSFVVECGKKNCPVKPTASTCGPWGYPHTDDLPSDEVAKKLTVTKWNMRNAT